jgi:hypothetical protein
MPPPPCLLLYAPPPKPSSRVQMHIPRFPTPVSRNRLHPSGPISVFLYPVALNLAPTPICSSRLPIPKSPALNSHGPQQYVRLPNSASPSPKCLLFSQIRHHPRNRSILHSAIPFHPRPSIFFHQPSHFTRDSTSIPTPRRLHIRGTVSDYDGCAPG